METSQKTPAEQFLHSTSQNQGTTTDQLGETTVYRVILSTPSIEQGEDYKQELLSHGFTTDEITVVGKLTGATVRVYALNEKQATDKRDRIINTLDNVTVREPQPHTIS